MGRADLENLGRKLQRQRLDPGPKVRGRISFRSTNLIGSFQDDGLKSLCGNFKKYDFHSFFGMRFCCKQKTYGIL
jgi:hypothetical protein